MYTTKHDSQKESNNTCKLKHNRERKKVKPEIRDANKKCQVENDYYDMKPSLTKSPAQHQLTFNDDYCTRTSQESFSHGGEDAASMISFGSIPSSSTGSENPSSAHSFVEVDTFIESLLAKGCVDEILETLQPMSYSLHGCEKMRSSGCLPFLIRQLHIHPTYEEENRPNQDTRTRVLHILTNIVQNQSSDRQSRRESKVLDILWLIRQYSDLLRDFSRACKKHEQGGDRVQETGCENVQIHLFQKRENLQDFIVCGKIIIILCQNYLKLFYFRFQQNEI